MATLDPNYALCAPLQESILDKDTGLPLVGGIVTFYSDSNRTVLKDVYELSEIPGPAYSYVSLGSQLVLGNAGQFVDGSGNNIVPELWLLDGTPNTTTGVEDLYYITVYAAAPPIGSGLLQFTVSAWPRVTNFGSIVTEQASNVNQVNNPQFVETLLTNGNTVVSVTGAGTQTLIAPDWYLVTNGTGTVTITPTALTLTEVPGNAPYALTFSNWTGSITTAYLQQVATSSPNLLAGSFVNAQMAVASNDAVGHAFTFNVIDGGSVTTVVAQGSSSPDGAFSVITGVSGVDAIQLPPATASAPPLSTVFQIVLPISASFSITSIQLVSTVDGADGSNFLQLSTPLQKNGLFNYYEPYLNFKPIPSYLVGWDFRLNPAQWGSTVAAKALGSNTSYYLWDQTILFQSVTSSVNAARNASGTNGLLLTMAATGQIALIQYLPAEDAIPILNQVTYDYLSVNVQCSCSSTINVSVSLYWTTNASLPSIGSNNSLVTSLDSNGVPTVVGGWTLLKRTGANSAFFQTNGGGILAEQNYGLNGWHDNPAYSGATYFAIVVGTSSIPNASLFLVNSISLVPGNIPTIPAPETYSQVLAKCQYYYEISYDITTTMPTTNPAGTATFLNAKIVNQNVYWGGGLTGQTYANAFEVLFSVEKVTAPAIKFYSGAGTADNVSNTCLFYDGASWTSSGEVDTVVATYWSQKYVSTKLVCMSADKVNLAIATVGSHSSALNAFIAYHFVADARLGTF